MRQRPLRGLALFTVLSLAIAACGGPGATTVPSTGAASVPASQPAESEPAESEPAESEPAESEPAESEPAESEPAESEPAPSGSAGAGLTGAMEVLAQYTEADEIATTRYDIFTGENPDLQVTFTESNFDAAAFLASVAAGNPPDVVRMDRAIIGTYVANGALDPIDQCITDRAIDMSQYREAAVDAVTMGGAVYGIPEFYDSRIILVNDSVLEEVDLTVEDIDTSDWDALTAVNDQLLAREGDNITRIGFDPKIPEFLPLWAAANGSSLISDDGLTSNLNDPAVAEALEYAASLVRAHGSASDFLDFRGNGPGGVDFFGAQNQFVEDTLGAFPMEQWYLNVLAGASPEEGVSFAPFRDRQGNEITFASGSAWVIPAAADNKEAACEFMRVITLPDTWYAAAEVRATTRAADGEPFTGTYTANSVADERIFSELVTEESAGAYFEGVQLALSTADNAISLPPNAAAEEFTRIWQEAVQRVLAENVPAADALADAHQEAQQRLDAAQP